MISVLKGIGANKRAVKQPKHDKRSNPSRAYGKMTKQEIFFCEISERLDNKEWKDKWIKEIPEFINWYRNNEKTINPDWSHQDIVIFYFNL